MTLELDSNEFKIRLKEVRKIRKLTQQELAEKTGIPVTSIAHFESGSRKPSLENFYKDAIIRKQGESKYSWKDLFKMININNGEELKEFYLKNLKE